MYLWIGVYLPHLPLEVFRPTWSIERRTGLVVLEGERVLTTNRQAREAGIRTGMRRASALTLLPEIDFRERDPALENAAVQSLAMALMQYSPQLSFAKGLYPNHAVLLLNISASLRLFGGIRALYRRIRETIRICGLSARLSLAPTGCGALLLARANAGHALHLSSHRRNHTKTTHAARRSLEQVLNGLPLQLLPAALQFSDWLTGLGCHTLGDIRKLPRAGLKRRCGVHLLDMLDQALGQSADCFEWLVLPDRFDSRQELPDRTEDTAPILACATAMVAQLTGWLVSRQLAVTQIRFYLEHERGRDAALAPTVIAISLAQPSWHDKHLLRLFTERLAQITLDAAVLAVRLEVTDMEAAQPPSISLFPDPGGNAGNHRQLLELLGARLGNDRISYCLPCPDHRPEIANRWQTQDKMPTRRGTQASGTTAMPANMDIPNMPRPAWLLPIPLPLLTRQHRPFYGSPLRIVSPGERIEAGWWDDNTVTRDYFVAQASDHSFYWVFRERLHKRDQQEAQEAQDSPEPDDVRWFLHGLFG